VEHAPGFYPALATLFYTGMRRSEVLGLQWCDVDFTSRQIHVRRAIVKSQLTTPKSGHDRRVVMASALASLLLDLLAVRRREAMALGLPEMPAWVFPARSGQLRADMATVQRRAQAECARPLKLHCTRHTWASLAFAGGKPVPLGRKAARSRRPIDNAACVCARHPGART